MLATNYSQNQLKFLTLRTLSSSGNALNSLIAPLLTYKIFGSQALMGLAFAIEFLPRVIFGLYSGQIIQKLGAHKVYLMSELIRAFAFALMIAAGLASSQNGILAFALLLMALPMVQAGAGLLDTISEESAGYATGSEPIGQTICRISDKFSRIFVMPAVGISVYLTNDILLPSMMGVGLMLISFFYSRTQYHLIYHSDDKVYQPLKSTITKIWSNKEHLTPTLVLTLLTIPMAMQWSIVPIFLGMDPQNPQSYRDFSFFAAIEALIIIFGVSTLLNKPAISRKATWGFLLITYFICMYVCLMPLDRVLLAAAHIGWVLSVVCIGVLVRVERQERLTGTDKATHAGVLGALEQVGYVLGGLTIAVVGSPNFITYTVPSVIALFLAIKMFKGFSND